jgi:hypothetical protein
MLEMPALKGSLLGTEYCVHLPLLSTILLQQFPGEDGKYASRILPTPQLTPKWSFYPDLHTLFVARYVQGDACNFGSGISYRQLISLSLFD